MRVSCCCSALGWGVFLLYTVAILVGDNPRLGIFLPRDEARWCRAARDGYPDGVVKHYPNPDANNNPCYYERSWRYLLGMSRFEVTFARRMIASVLLGAAIGFERKAADRPAGVRTMSLVSLGACFFTMCGQHAFRATTQEWDAARVSAAIPSGVGFLGSALIWKHAAAGGDGAHEVHGLTTAASVWLSASIGIGAGGGLYILSAYAAVLVIVVLRIGPRMFFADDSSSFAAGGEEDTEAWDSAVTSTGDERDDEDEEDEKRPLTRSEQRQMLEEQSKHSKPATGGQRRRRSSIQRPPTFGS